jgi:hypothetical protein
MPPQLIFQIGLVFGYIAWLLCFRAYLWPRLKAMDNFSAHRAIATLHSFRFVGLVFLVPGFTGPHLPAAFAAFAAYWDLAASVLAILALLTARIRPLFWLFTVAFNLVGATDLLLDYRHAVVAGVGANPGELGAAFLIPVLTVPLLMITHVAALTLLLRSGHRMALWRSPLSVAAGQTSC